ncbi:MAG: DUF1574 domain-containing protein [Okeania sp. SIO2C9]|uniref:DUF1574 family protein n=1 Tax=Okeania sp. SIO2C9 TaxID=2607791 RepID=UPI0013BFBA80|nr:DUF1574 family protein [Okeania sp. SIO2C9]NEQ76540.1 DUF1574 domain-containing protein [Okeania sp. SIO2C9]
MKGNKTILTENRSPLGDWAQEALGLPEVQVQVRLRGNHLHILCEAEKCPEMNFALAQFSQALGQVDLESLLPPNQPRIYQMFLCGRALGRRRPDWTVKLDGNKVTTKGKQVNTPSSSSDSKVNTLSRSNYVAPAKYSQNQNDSHILPEGHLTKVTAGQSPKLDINHNASELLSTPHKASVLTNDILDHSELVSSPKLDSENSSVTESQQLNELEIESENTEELDRYLIDSPLTVSYQRLAKYGHPDAIASYLSEVLGELGVSVNVSIRERQLKEKLTETTPQSEDSAKSPELKTHKILWVSCEAAYSPAPSLLAEPIAQKLRDLKLKDFHEALISLLVQGETAPDWMLRVDLTPPDLMLQEWASWGDVAAIERLLQQQFTTLEIKIRATLKESTLHLFCTNTNNSDQLAPDKKKTKEAIASILSTILPRGIQAATIYGCIINEPEQKSESPLWIDWLNLPASENPEMAASAKVLASQGNYEAISFLLNKLLNPDLDQKLQTGGIRVLILPKQELLHVMSEAPTCPSQSQVGPPIAQFLRQLQVPGISGVRVYGRRAGQKLPLWRYGINFTARSRQYSEQPPEFAASAEMDLLLGKRADRVFLKLTPQKTEKFDSKLLIPNNNYTVTTQLFTAIQQLLITSRLFIPNEEYSTQMGNSLTYNTFNSGKWVTAFACAFMGILFTVQTDLKLGAVLEQLPDISRSGNICQGPNCQTPTEVNEDSVEAPEFSTYPSFNSPQLDEQLVRYQQYLQVENKLPDILIVGSSRALRGVNPTVLEESLATAGYPNLRVYNFGINGATAQVVDLIVRQVLPAEQLPPLIIFADGVRALNSGREDRTFDIIASSEGYEEVDAGTFTIETNTSEAYVNFGIKKYKQIFKELQEKTEEISLTYQQRDRLKSLISSIINNPQENWNFWQQKEGENVAVEEEDIDKLDEFQSNGFLPISIKFEPESYYQNYAKVSGKYDADYANFQLPGKQITALKNLLQYTQSIGINFVFVNMPLTTAYLDEARTNYEQKFQEYMQQLPLEYSNFLFRDLGAAWPDAYDKFSDPSHLNLYGAIAVSQQLAEDNIIPWLD